MSIDTEVTADMVQLALRLLRAKYAWKGDSPQKANDHISLILKEFANWSEENYWRSRLGTIPDWRAELPKGKGSLDKVDPENYCRLLHAVLTDTWLLEEGHL